MNKIIAFLFFAFLGLKGFSQTYVKGYYKANGTYVKGYYRSSPNHTTKDNYSTRGNINPYTGNTGTKKSYYQQEHKTQRTIYTGPRGGKYYISSKGNKQYVK